MKLWTLIVVVLLSGRLEARLEDGDYAIKWPEGQEIAITKGKVTYPGLRHSTGEVEVNFCHKRYMARAQQTLLAPRFAADKNCLAFGDVQTFELVVANKKQTIKTCSRLMPRFQRVLQQMISCSRRSVQ